MGKKYQEQHWDKQHRFECVGGKDDKREREEEGEGEGEGEEKKLRVNVVGGQPLYEEVNLSDLP